MTEMNLGLIPIRDFIRIMGNNNNIKKETRDVSVSAVRTKAESESCSHSTSLKPVFACWMSMAVSIYLQKIRSPFVP
jgi:hypothetical protein